MKEIRNRKLLWMTAASGIFSFLVLNRWVVTDLKEKSFGRVWQYYVSWVDFGFHRRGLVGTLLTESGLNSVFQNEYLFAYFIYGILIAISYFLIVKVLISNEKLSSDNILIFCVLFSPAIFLHFAYSSGNQDILLFILFLIAIFFTQSALGLSLVVVSGLLVHELFVFFLPCIFMLKFIANEKPKLWPDWRIIRPAIAALVTILVIMVFGKINVSASTFEFLMSKRIPIAAYQHPLWSGYNELASSLQDNMNTGENMISHMWLYKYHLLIPSIYAVFIAWMPSWFMVSRRTVKITMFAVIVFPLIASCVAADYYRWIAISACLGLFSMILLISKNMLSVPKWTLVMLMFFSVFSPFGSAVLDRPFPMHQLLMEKIFR